MEDLELDRQRPLEVRVRAPGMPSYHGTTERQANSLGRSSADIVMVLRGLIMEDGALSLGLLALNGHDLDHPLSPSAVFHMWVSMTGVLARMEAEEGDTQGAQQINFAKKVLTLLRLDAQMQAMSGGGGGGDADEEDAEAIDYTATPPSSSTPAEPSLPTDGTHSFEG